MDKSGNKSSVTLDNSASESNIDLIPSRPLTPQEQLDLEKGLQFVEAPLSGYVNEPFSDKAIGSKGN